MKLRVPRTLVRHVGGPIVGAMASSWRIRVEGQAHRDELGRSGAPFVYLLWHEALLPLLWHHRHRGIHIVVSEAREGRYLGDFAERLGYRLLQGSSTRGGLRALLGAMRALREGHVVAFTPDGPRGPRRVVKPGIVRAAQDTGAAILPVHAIVHRSWQLRSWDRMKIPTPWSLIDVRYGPPFMVPPDADGLERGVRQCADALDALEREMLS